ncbi:tRNA dihydrouridine synthase DusB [Candidatus Uhrbacteria bacterium]|nr:tRNA dihydrouridine synthase DusB [Candidatus Uhrbacteria bacterium]
MLSLIPVYLLNWKSLPRPIIALSPMADMTDSAFCRVVRLAAGSVQLAAPKFELNNLAASCSLPAAGYPIMFREMVSSEAVVRGNEKTLGMTDIHPDERPLVQQIFGSEPATMAESARIIEAQHHPEGFDINMGCPVYKITHNFNGAALMKEPARATAIIKAMKAVITVPLSVKIRAGWSDKTECFEFAKAIEDAGADLITVHGRTKVQGYSGKSEWDVIRQAKEKVSIPVLANGDIHSPTLVPGALKQTGCDGVLIARGALGNPWFFRDTADVLAGKEPVHITLEERIRVVLMHARLHAEQHGQGGITTLRKHLSWYFKGQPGVKEWREKMMKMTTLEELEEVLGQMMGVTVLVRRTS